MAYHCLDLDNAATEHIVSVVSALANRGHNITLFAPRATRNIPGVDHLPIDSPKGILFDYSVSKFLSDKFDLLYFRDFAGGHRTVLSAKKLGMPVVVEHNGLIHLEGPRMRGNLLRHMLVKYDIHFSMRRKLNLGDIHITVTNALGKFLSEYYDIPLAKFCHIPNGVDVLRFHPKNKSIIRRELGLNDSAILVGYIGAMHPWHILDKVVEGVGITMRENKNIYFFIGGEGLELNRVKRFIKDLPSDKVFTMFPVPIDRSPDYIASLDLGIAMMEPQLAPYCWQVKINNYSACGVPSLATECDEFDELVSANMIIPTKPTPSSISEKILFFAQNPDKLNEMGNSARQYVEKNLSWEKIIIKIEDICASLLKGGKQCQKCRK